MVSQGGREGYVPSEADDMAVFSSMVLVQMRMGLHPIVLIGGRGNGDGTITVGASVHADIGLSEDEMIDMATNAIRQYYLEVRQGLHPDPLRD